MTDNTNFNRTGGSEEQFLQRVSAELDHSCDALDGATLSRLNQIRNQALEKRTGKRSSLLLPFGGLVTACVLVLTISLNWQAGRMPEAGSSLPLEDIDILSAGESLDFYEDYEFYQWLAENDISA